jgi:hypothetical protein
MGRIALENQGALLKKNFQNGGRLLTIALVHLYTPPPWGCGEVAGGSRLGKQLVT